MISFRLVTDQRPDAGSGSGEPREPRTDGHTADRAGHELWPEPVGPQAAQPPLPRYHRLGD
ncbi:hypothetical protein [Nocardioides taihuensis]|uniref:Uncharacterized protein n=1 Tax=Nocardioides taihuensis TaxID=1835606 RepID=A0ABW0BNW2_9ACTN